MKKVIIVKDYDAEYTRERIFKSIECLQDFDRTIVRILDNIGGHIKQFGGFERVVDLVNKKIISPDDWEDDSIIRPILEDYINEGIPLFPRLYLKLMRTGMIVLQSDIGETQVWLEPRWNELTEDAKKIWPLDRIDNGLSNYPDNEDDIDRGVSLENILHSVRYIDSKK